MLDGVLSQFKPGPPIQKEPVRREPEKKVMDVHRPGAPEPKHTGFRMYWSGETGNLPFRMQIKHKGLIDIDGTYRVMYDWLKENKYIVEERLYKSRPPELEIHWRAWKNLDVFYRYEVYVRWHGFIDDVEVAQDGMKKKMSNGRMRIQMWGHLEVDYPNLFGDRNWTAGFQRQMFNFFLKWVVRRDLEFVWDDLYYEVYKLHAVVKDYLDLAAKGNYY